MSKKTFKKLTFILKSNSKHMAPIRWNMSLNVEEAFNSQNGECSYSQLLRQVSVSVCCSAMQLIHRHECPWTPARVLTCSCWLSRFVAPSGRWFGRGAGDLLASKDHGHPANSLLKPASSVWKRPLLSNLSGVLRVSLWACQRRGFKEDRVSLRAHNAAGVVGLQALCKLHGLLPQCTDG